LVRTSGGHLHSLINHQRFYVAGEPVELWEDPRLPFGCAFTDLEAYCLGARWELLFNAIVLACLARLDADEDELRRPAPQWEWAFAAESPSHRDDERDGH